VNNADREHPETSGRTIDLIAEPLRTPDFALAENPLFNERNGTLYWTDIDAGELWARPTSGAATRIYEGPKVGGFTLERDDALILFRETDLARFDPVAGEVRSLADFHEPGTERFNDVAALPDGSALAGTIGQETTRTRLHSVRRGEAGITLTPISGTDTRISNGLALSPDHTAIHWTDTTNAVIARFALGPGGPSQRIDLIHTADENAGFPDGLCADDRGNLYSARWAGGQVAVYSPAGDRLGSVTVPGVANVTSACFGGTDRRTLFITTAGGPLYQATMPIPGPTDQRTALAV